MGLLYSRKIDAVFSEDRVYRFSWTCEWGRGPHLCVVMCNPSMANEKYPDPTITRVLGFARDHQFEGIEVVNLYALVSTNPDGLFTHEHPVGKGNTSAIEQAARKHKTILCAWGAHPLIRERARFVVDLLRKIKGVKLYHLGITKDGQPRHPLYVPASTPLTEWQNSHENR